MLASPTDVLTRLEHGTTATRHCIDEICGHAVFSGRAAQTIW